MTGIKEAVTETWFQVEFYSDTERRWVALFGRVKSGVEAEAARRDWLREAHSRVVKVTQTMEVVEGDK